ncbi:MAG: LysM peptidoglycan-binding domain-containing protein [Anaerolineales bacterium]|nr:LysM peptidoglycan-binding domain-containing protein [Anaerolineales bacterium]
MKKSTRSFASCIIISLVLTACGFGSSPTATPALTIQATPTAGLSEMVQLELTAQTDPAIQYNTVGQIVKYNFTIKVNRNDSVNVPPNISIPGLALNCPPINTVGNLDDRLDAGESITCTAEYALTQDDLNRGSLASQFTANVYSVNSNQSSVTITTVPAHALTLTKTANPTAYATLGQTITYTYVITNSGATSLGPAQFTVTDPAFPSPINCGAADTTLASAATITCSATYSISQADMSAASVTTNATAAGSGASSQAVGATITKSAATNNLAAGSTVQHKVVAGEWLWQIARCYGADPVKVSAANPPRPGEISPDTIVTVPNIGSAGKIYGPPCVGTHTVQPGDTWESIAQKYNASVVVLKMVNKNTLSGTLLVPLNSAGAAAPAVTPSASNQTCLDVIRSLKLTGTNSGPTTFKICGQIDSANNLKIASIQISQKTAEVGANVITQDLTIPVQTSTNVNDVNSFIIGDMNYDGNDDFRIVEFLPAGANIPYLYFLYDPATNKFVYNEAYRGITSPEFPGSPNIQSKWRDSATKWGIDTYTLTNNTPKLTKRETWEALNATQAKHQVIVFNVDGSSQTTVDETVPLPIP